METLHAAWILLTAPFPLFLIVALVVTTLVVSHAENCASRRGEA